MVVLLFKTTVRKRRNIRYVAPHLNRLIQNDGKWNFDLEDQDNVLRVVGNYTNGFKIIQTLKRLGFCCIELY